jgi:hypothetical protein
VIFCLDARVEFTPDEKQSISRYKLQNEVIYNSEAQLRLLAKSEAQRDGSVGGGLKGLATMAFAHTKLHITIGSLERGQHIECKSLEELIGAEEAMLAACQNLKSYLDTALTFDGREVLIDFATGAPAIVAQSVTPPVMLAAPAEKVMPAIAEIQSVPAIPTEYPPPTTAPAPPWEEPVGEWEEAIGRRLQAWVEAVMRIPPKAYPLIVLGLLALLALLKVVM